jgi:hypothetical protein
MGEWGLDVLWGCRLRLAPRCLRDTIHLPNLNRSNADPMSAASDVADPIRGGDIGGACPDRVGGAPLCKRVRGTEWLSCRLPRYNLCRASYHSVEAAATREARDPSKQGYDHPV